jgi:hypothetical protein
MRYSLRGQQYKMCCGRRTMTKDQMIEELVEYELQNVPAIELIRLYVELQRALLQSEYDEDEITKKYNSLMNTEGVVH